MPIVKYKTNGNWVAIPTSGAIATDTTYGYVKIATNQDVEEGTDDTAAITAKKLKDYSDGNFVHLTGNETIGGTKTFTSIPYVLKASPSEIIVKSSDKDSTVTPTDNYQVGRISIYDKNDKTCGYWYCEKRDDGDIRNTLETRRYDSEGNYKYTAFQVYCDSDSNGIGYCSIGTSESVNNSLSKVTNSTSDSTVPTMGWVNNPSTSTNVVHRTGDETIAGTKTFTNFPLILRSYASNDRDERIKNIWSNVKLANNEALPTDSVFAGFHSFDANNFEYSTCYSQIDVNGTVYSNLWVHHPSGSASHMGIKQTASGATVTYAPTPPASDNSTQIATTAWVNSKIKFVTALPANPESGVLYLIPET